MSCALGGGGQRGPRQVTPALLEHTLCDSVPTARGEIWHLLA